MATKATGLRAIEPLSPHSAASHIPLSNTSESSGATAGITSPANTIPLSLGGRPSPRSVRSAPSSPSGRTLPAGLAPLSVISPIRLHAALQDESMDAARAKGGRSGLDAPHVGRGNGNGLSYGMEGVHMNAGAGPSRIPAGQVPASQSIVPPSIRSQPLQFISAPVIPTRQTPSRPLIPKQHRSRSRPIPRSSASSGSETETGVESDSTIRPGRLKTQSLSQPDLVALRNRLEGWVGDVAAQQQPGKSAQVPHGPKEALDPPWTSQDHQASGKAGEAVAARPQMEKRRSSYGRKTPPARYSSIEQQSSPDAPIRKSPASRSFPSLTAVRALSNAPSHVRNIPPITPTSPLLALSDSVGSSPRLKPVGGMTSSEDADDDLDSTDSPSSGSISFSPKKRDRDRDLRRRLPFKERSSDFVIGGVPSSASTGRATGGLGLVFGDSSSGAETTTGIKDINRTVLPENSLFSLRLLAVFPAVWGYLVLMQAFITGGIWVNLYPWGIDTSREALDRVITGWGFEGTWAGKARGDMLLAAAWAVLTGHYCFDMTTGLTHRWRVYYDLPATITRLLSIQCICWPLTGVTLWVLGPERILFAWVTIGCTTAASRSVQMYVTSNIPSSLPGQSASINGNGDITPRRRVSPLLSESRSRGRSPVRKPNLNPGDPRQGQSGGSIGLPGRWWTQFKVDREWNWDIVAWEVGYKLGVLLLLTNAWLFWGIEVGRFGSGSQNGYTAS